MHIQEVFDLIKDDIKMMDDGFKKNLNSDVWLVGKVGEYILTSGGKRFRPLVMLLASRLCGYKGERHTQIAGVIEFIHTATLLHDDVVDNSSLRRGAASANTIWGDGASILVGDYMLSKAFSLAVTHGNERILKVLSQAAARMAEGEVMQLLKHGDINITEKEYLDVITSKTAVLFSASAQFAAILGEVNLEREVALASYGMGLGIAYQLMDDSLDYTSTDEDLGKSVGNDLREGKVTLPLIYAYKKSSAAEKDIIKAAIGADEITGQRLNDVITVINRHGGIDYTLEKARAYVEGAKKNLGIFEPNLENMALIAVADFVIDRTY
ncbi:MAG: polyprenyl synthetase family protein [Deltaproteobacteria bacterium]|nr:polyprenyl synthetase family protein [Deltaproteobacteria bacterium]